MTTYAPMAETAHSVNFALDSSRIRQRSDGSIIVAARVARSGLQTYANGVAYRPETEVTAKESLDSLVNVAVTIGHPPDSVSAANWSNYAVGQVVGTPRVVRVDSAEDGRGETFIEADLHITNPGAIHGVMSKDLCELSCGYAYQHVSEAGQIPGTSQAYDFTQREIRHNHVALLENGTARAGRLARVLDTGEQDNMADIEKLNVELESVKAELGKANDQIKTLVERLAASDQLATDAAEKAARDATAEAIDAAVKSQLKLRDDVAKVVDCSKGYPFEGESEAVVHEAVVRRACAEDSINPVEGSEDVYFRARFDQLVASRLSAKPSLVTNVEEAADAVAPVHYKAAYAAKLAGIHAEALKEMK